MEGFSGVREMSESKKWSFFVHCHFPSDCKFSSSAVGNWRHLHILTNGLL